MNTLKTILVPIDFSIGSRSALEQAARLAGLNGASLHVLHVWQEPWLSTPYACLATVAAEFIKERKQHFRATLKQLVSETAPDIESNEVLVKEPNYANGIATHAEKSEADLIVIGAKGQTNLRYVLMGSTAE